MGEKSSNFGAFWGSYNMRNYVRSSMEKEHKRENGWWRNELLSVKDHITLLKLLSDTKLFLKIIAITHSIWIHARQPCWIKKPTSQHKKSSILRYKNGQHKKPVFRQILSYLK